MRGRKPIPGAARRPAAAWIRMRGGLTPASYGLLRGRHARATPPPTRLKANSQKSQLLTFFQRKERRTLNTMHSVQATTAPVISSCFLSEATNYISSCFLHEAIGTKGPKKRKKCYPSVEMSGYKLFRNVSGESDTGQFPTGGPENERITDNGQK
jgi:hypothetical protein